ncbi:hypothetical protein GFGA_1c1246 [Gluconobacter frateurii NBRC 103465]|nr:hypothetical protein GFGA_1c1246 [Gluconobacter frateurii NBRC 103465]
MGVTWLEMTPSLEFGYHQSSKKNIEDAAARNQRSLNAEIVHRLENSCLPRTEENLVLARVNKDFAERALSDAQALAAELESDPTAQDIDKSLARLEVRRAKMSLESVMARIKMLEGGGD